MKISKRVDELDFDNHYEITEEWRNKLNQLINVKIYSENIIEILEKIKIKDYIKI